MITSPQNDKLKEIRRLNRLIDVIGDEEREARRPDSLR